MFVEIADGLDCGVDLAFVSVVQFEHAVGALDDLHAGFARGGFERNVRQLIDCDARCNFNKHRAFLFARHEARAHGL